MSEIIHRQLSCGIEFAGEVLPSRHAVCVEIRFFGGLVYEPPEHLGLAHTLIETIDKGTEKRDAKAISDALDEIGVRHSAWSGREAVGFNITCLPEFIEPAIDIQVEMIRQPVFPQDLLDVALDLSHQELRALEDDPRELADKYLSMQTYGDPLGRHALGTHESLDSLSREKIVDYWKKHISPGRMQVAMAGAFDPDRIVEKLEAVFDGFGQPEQSGRDQFNVEFNPVRSHHHKELEQEHISICYPGAPIQSDAYPVQRVLIGVLSGGMSGRLFTEIREKQGLVYWVGAWTDYPRGAGFIHLGAGTSPERCDKTYESLFREIDRLADDLVQSELDRAITGIVARTETRGDITSARCARLSDDLFHYGRPIPIEEKIRRVKAVSLDDLRSYLDRFPRDQLSVVTLGPKELTVA